MTSLFIVVAIVLVGGVAASLQGPLTSLMGKHVGIMGSVFIIHLGGTIASALFLLWPGASDLSAWRSVPWYALPAGVLGLVLLGALSYSIPRIGVVATITLVIAMQLLVSACLDHFGWLVDSVRPFDGSRALGVVILFLGAWLVVR